MLKVSFLGVCRNRSLNRPAIVQKLFVRNSGKPYFARYVSQKYLIFRLFLFKEVENTDDRIPKCNLSKPAGVIIRLELKMKRVE